MTVDEVLEMFEAFVTTVANEGQCIAVGDAFDWIDTMRAALEEDHQRAWDLDRRESILDSDASL